MTCFDFFSTNVDNFSFFLINGMMIAYHAQFMVYFLFAASYQYNIKVVYFKAIQIIQKLILIICIQYEPQNNEFAQLGRSKKTMHY